MHANFCFVFLILGCFFSGLQARAWETAIKLDTFAGAASQDIQESIFNPGNRVYYLSSDIGFLEVRPEGRLDLFDSTLRFVLRPRARGVAQTQPELSPPGGEQLYYWDLYMNEAFVSIRPTDSAEVIVGRQNYQWGPAELLNPSNMLFPELLTRTEPFYEVRGRTMARVNIGLGMEWSWVTMVELNPLRDENFENDASVKDTSLNRIQTKLEYAWDNASKIVGMTVGKVDVTDETLVTGGGYGSYAINDAFQIYTDFVLQKDHLAAGVGTEAIAYYGIAGVRYTTASGAEFRLEEVRNGFGKSREELDEVRAYLTDPSTRFEALSTLGFSRAALPGRDYIYAAFRHSSQATIANLFRQPMLSIRSLVSLNDGSSFSSMAFETGLSDWLTLYLFGGIAAGNDDSELRQALNRTVGVALRASI